MANRKPRRNDPVYSGFYRDYKPETESVRRIHCDEESLARGERRRAIEDRLEQRRLKEEEVF